MTEARPAQKGFTKSGFSIVRWRLTAERQLAASARASRQREFVGEIWPLRSA
jgi:hypothetical protein